MIKKTGVRPMRVVSELADTSDAKDESCFSIIDSRKLERECFVRAVRSANEDLSVCAYGSAREWHDSSDRARTRGVLFSLGGARASDPTVASLVRDLVAGAGDIPVIVLAESEDLREMIAAIDCGARGYVPTSVGVDAIIEAAHLTSAGGIFLPASSLATLRDVIPAGQARPAGIEDHFTSRQAAVANALRQGKANKTIAYELNMCESTVKVHIRTIMKKLRASNRTEAAFKLSELFPRDQHAGAAGKTFARPANRAGNDLP